MWNNVNNAQNEMMQTPKEGEKNCISRITNQSEIKKRFSHLWIFHTLNRFIFLVDLLKANKRCALCAVQHARTGFHFAMWFLCVFVCALACTWICQIIVRPLKFYSRFSVNWICISTLSIRIFATSVIQHTSFFNPEWHIMHFMHLARYHYSQQFMFEMHCMMRINIWIYQTFQIFH